MKFPTSSLFLLSILFLSGHLKLLTQFIHLFALNAFTTIDDSSYIMINKTMSSFGGMYYDTLCQEKWSCSYGKFSNPLTNSSSCPSESILNCFDTGYDSLENSSMQFCSCQEIKRNAIYPGFGGLYSTYLMTNPISGNHSCPQGFTARGLTSVCEQCFDNLESTCRQVPGNCTSVDPIYMCIGENMNTPSYIYGGMYVVSSEGCYPNPYTHKCSCPHDTPNTIIYPYPFAIEFYWIHWCYGRQ
jgi:hypothetical protein